MGWVQPPPPLEKHGKMRPPGYEFCGCVQCNPKGSKSRVKLFRAHKRSARQRLREAFRGEK